MAGTNQIILPKRAEIWLVDFDPTLRAPATLAVTANLFI